MQKTLGIIAIGFCLSLYQLATAATWYVDASVPSSGDGTTWDTAFKTIQEGIDVSSDGDTVIVAEGTYVQNIHFNGRNITLSSTNPLDSPVVVANTIIDGNQAGPVVTFSGTEDETCLLSGFTIRNGLAPQGGGICGGSGEKRSRATIENSVISGNWADSGGGLLCCDGTIRNNVISRNRAGGLSYRSGQGGAIAYCDGTILNNTVAENWAQNAGGGLSNCRGTIANNVITGNSAASSAGLSKCDGVICNNVISLNCALSTSPGYGAGGGLAACNGTISNNVVVSNSASVAGGGVAICFGVITNNTIVWNTARTGGGLYGCDAVILNCIIWHNTPLGGSQLRDSSLPSHSCIEGWTNGGEANTSEDPRFADGEFRLFHDSPCIDVGMNEEWMWQAVDLDGNPRIWNQTVDMGAYEYGSFHFKVVDVIEEAGNGAQVTWNSRPGDSYAVWSCLDLLIGEWIEEATVPAMGVVTWWSDLDRGHRCKFYRIGIEQ